ncbi:MAG: hypothetical protein A2Y14_00780 [Verrucomicrobia bacterium GWF2_51_19]|nr:MAG: hypothetical protein A2Y14_00780 [Verrucomicrobia bacterium GWF2_51_19]
MKTYACEAWKLRYGKTHAAESIIDIALKKVLESAKKNEESNDVIMKSWKDLVGPQASHRCTPITFSEGCLTVSVNNATLRSTLEMQKSKILEKLKTLPNCQNAQRIHFQAG